jgi:ferredoxin
MADKTAKLPENIAGAWYVDNTCTPCRVCLDVPLATNFMQYIDGDDGKPVVFFKQPEGEDELKAADEAMAVCPQNAIGNDGE